MTRNIKSRSRTIELYSERPIRNERDLLRFVLALDEDEGIRIQGNLKSHANGGFVFVGYYRESYCVNYCDKIWSPTLRKYITGGNDKWFYFESAKETVNHVISVARRPLDAWLY